MSNRMIRKTIPTKPTTEAKTPLILLRVLEKYEPEKKNFETKEEFQLYLSEHLDEMNLMTTQKLNRTFIITGCRITKLLNAEKTKSEISLKSDKSYQREKQNVKEARVGFALKTLDEKIESIIEVLKERELLVDEDAENGEKAES
jgi:hypothetical protein